MTEIIMSDFENMKQNALAEIRDILGDQLQEFSSMEALTRDGTELLHQGIGGVTLVSTERGRMLVLAAGLLARATKERQREIAHWNSAP